MAHVKHWLGLTYFNPWNNILTIAGDSNIIIIIKLADGIKFKFNHIKNNEEYILPCSELIVKKNDKKKIVGYENFITNLSHLIKNFIRDQNVEEKEYLDTVYMTVYNTCREILKNLEAG